MIPAAVVAGAVVVVAALVAAAEGSGPDPSNTLATWNAGITVAGFVVLGVVAFFVGRSQLAKARDTVRREAAAAKVDLQDTLERIASAEVHRRELAEQDSAKWEATAKTLLTENQKLHDRTDLTPLLEALMKKWHAQDDRAAEHSQEHAGIMRAVERLADAHSDEVTARQLEADAMRQTLERLNGSIDRLLESGAS